MNIVFEHPTPRPAHHWFFVAFWVGAGLVTGGALAAAWSLSVLKVVMLVMP